MLIQDLDHSTGRSVTVMPVEFSVPVVAGIETYLSCPSGLQLSGPETATCMKNGEWEPEIRFVTCRGENCMHDSLMINLNRRSILGDGNN